MKPRPLEIKAVAELLEEPAEDALELATRIVERITELRLGAHYYSIVPAQPGDLAFHQAYGLETTRGQAEKKALKTWGDGASFRLVRLNPWEERVV